LKSISQSLRDLIDNLNESWTPDEKHFIEIVAADYASLIQRRIAGEDVAQEMVQLRAQASSIVVGAAGSLSTTIEEGIRKFLTDMISELVPGL